MYSFLIFCGKELGGSLLVPEQRMGSATRSEKAVGIAVKSSEEIPCLGDTTVT